MKIAQVVCTYPPYKGGIGNSAQDLSNIFEEKGHKITTFTGFFGEEEKNDKDNKIIRLRSFIKAGKGMFLPQLFWRLKDFDTVYLHYPFFGASEVIWFYKMLSNKRQKLIIHYHMDVVLSSSFLKFLSLPSKLIFNSLFKRADVVVSASFDYIENSNLAKFYKKNKYKFIEIPFGVNLNKFSPSEKEKENSCFKIIFVGGLDKNHYFKGVDILLKAVSKLDGEWKLDIVGDGDMKKSYEEMAKELDIKNKINFLGRVSDSNLPKIYRGADVCVLPSVNQGEAFGIVLIEALSSGLPVIASDLAGVRSVFEQGVEGLKVIPGDINDLKEKIKYIKDNRVKRKEMSRNARILAEKRYNIENIKQKLDNILNI